jgi:hypothetical protein
MAGIKSESVADFIPESVADFVRNQQFDGLFGEIIFFEAPIVTAGEAQLPERRAVGAQLIGDQQLRCKALFLEQFAPQPERRVRIAPTLREHVEDLALVVDGAP